MWVRGLHSGSQDRDRDLHSHLPHPALYPWRGCGAGRGGVWLALLTLWSPRAQSTANSLVAWAIWAGSLGYRALGEALRACEPWEWELGVRTTLNRSLISVCLLKLHSHQLGSRRPQAGAPGPEGLRALPQQAQGLCAAGGLPCLSPQRPALSRTPWPRGLEFPLPTLSGHSLVGGTWWPADTWKAWSASWVEPAPAPAQPPGQAPLELGLAFPTGCCWQVYRFFGCLYGRVTRLAGEPAAHLSSSSGGAWAWA